MDSVKIAEAIVSAGFGREQGHTRAALKAVEGTDGYAVVVRKEEVYFGDRVHKRKNYTTLDQLVHLPQLTQLTEQETLCPVVFDCHAVSQLCKELLKEIASRDKEIEKLKDRPSFHKKKGLAKLSNEEKEALGLKVSDEVLKKIAVPNHWDALPKAFSLSYSYLDNDGATQVGIGCPMAFFVPENTENGKDYFVNVALPAVFKKLTDLGHEVKAFVGNPVSIAPRMLAGEVLASIPILSMGSLKHIKDLPLRVAEVVEEVLRTHPAPLGCNAIPSV